MSQPVLVEVIRSGLRESAHHGAVLAVRADGKRVLALGEVDLPIFPRSANKPLQARGLLGLGWPGVPRELALACASHNGEPAHVEVVADILSSAGLTASDLRCPAALPLSEPAAADLLAAGGSAASLFMNCSGKHAAMLATAVHLGLPTESYLDPEHPVQQAVRRSVEALAGETVGVVAVDACGAPQHALTPAALARAFSQLVRAADGTPEAAIVDAMRAHPDLVGGSGREVTGMMRAVPGLVAKDGAEGVFAAALPDGSAVVVKVGDGAARARTPILAAALRALGVPRDLLVPWQSAPVLGGGRVVGEVRVVGELAQY